VVRELGAQLAFLARLEGRLVVVDPVELEAAVDEGVQVVGGLVVAPGDVGDPELLALGWAGE